MYKSITNKLEAKKRYVQLLLKDLEVVKNKIENMRKGIEELIQMRRIYTLNGKTKSITK